MTRRIEYCLHFDSPFIVASGVAAPGRFDQVSILSEKLPYIPPSSIRGRIKAMMLQHCVENQGSWDKYRVCEGQRREGPYCIPDAAQGDYGICPLCRIFGIPGGEISRGFDFAGARFPEAVVPFLQKLYEPGEEGAVYLRHSRNRRDYLLRRVREDAFFSLGLAGPPLDMEGGIREMPIHLRYNSATQEFDYTLLLLTLCLVTELGGGRNRGYGRCRFIPKEAGAWDATINAHIEQWKRAKAHTEDVHP